MKYLGAIIGAAIGVFIFHNFFALLLGAAIGYGFDVSRHQRQRAKRVANREFVEPLFAVLGALAKSDGRVSESEIAVAEGVMRRLQLDEAWRRRAIEAFNEGKQPGFDLHAAIRGLRDWSGGHRDLGWPLLDVMVETVLAGGAPSEGKLQVLRAVARALGISELQLMAMLAMKGAARAQAGGWQPGARGPAGGGSRSGPVRTGIADPYAVLGLTPSADDATIKRTYRKLMSEHHPDRLGDLPEDLKRRAVERASAINAAYDQIKQQRGRK